MLQLQWVNRKLASEEEKARARTPWAHVRLLVLLCLGLLGVTLLGQSLTLLTASAAPAGPTGQRLRTLAGTFLIGYASADSFWTLPDASTYEATAASEFNVLTPENQLKWATVHPQQATYNFVPGDQHVQFARANAMTVHGHNLVWHQSNPAWLDGGTWTASTLSAVLNDHIDTVVGHYRGQIAMWDVVNEAFNDDGSRRSSVWSNTIGPSYIELAFRRAHTADPSAVLVYNDYNIETVNSKSNAVLAMAQDFVARGVPLNAIGLQMHVDENGVDLAGLSSNMQRFANLGLSIYITEMDVRLPMPPTAADLSNQATVYQNVLDRCRLQPACKGLQLWGFTDKYSWIPSFFPGLGAALIFDANYTAKPGYFALQSRLGGASVPTSTPIATATSTATPMASRTPTSTPTASATTILTPAPNAGASASFVAQDVTTHGNWKGVYGTQGYWLEADGQSVPGYAPVTFSNASTYTWTSSTSDPRALQKAASSSDRLAAVWYSPGQFVLDVNVTDGRQHKMSVYGLDWDQTGRAETIDVVDASSGVVLDRRSMSSFVYGAYLSWTVSGHVQLRVTRTAGSNAVVSGLFFD